MYTFCVVNVLQLQRKCNTPCIWLSYNYLQKGLNAFDEIWLTEIYLHLT